MVAFNRILTNLVGRHSLILSTLGGILGLNFGLFKFTEKGFVIYSLMSEQRKVPSQAKQ